MPGREHIVFIAYARSDELEVGRLADRLRSRGIRVGRDIESISIGQLWENALKNLIDEADTIIFIISPRSMTSQWCYGKSSMLLNRTSAFFRFS
jgi:hypothetical protein